MTYEPNPTSAKEVDSLRSYVVQELRKVADEMALVIPGYRYNYDDLPPIPLINQDRGVANKPTLAALQGNVNQLTFAVGDDVDGSQEIIHRYEQFTDIDPHIHMVTNGLEVADKTVKWQMEYTMSNIGSAFPASSTTVGEYTIPANTPDRTHILLDLTPEIDGSAMKIGGYVAYNFTRIASSGTEPAADPFALSVGFHVRQNSLGSRELDAK